MSKLNVHQRLAAVMAKVTYIQKERKQGMQYTVVSHDAVTAKVRPALLEAGIVYYPVRCEHTHNGNRAECSMTVRFVNVDEPGDFFDVPTFGYGIDPQDKGPGKAMSYAVKYALLKALGLETGDDPDTDAQTPPHQPEQTPAFDPEACDTRLRAAWPRFTSRADATDWWKRETDALGMLKDHAPQRYEALRADLAKLTFTAQPPSVDMIPGALAEA